MGPLFAVKRLRPEIQPVPLSIQCDPIGRAQAFDH
jgi:hypothetical protein